MTEPSQNTSIPNGTLLQIANNILDLLEYDSVLKDEDDLFSDQFFIVIVSHLVTDDKFDIKPGETEDEQVESLDKLITFLSNIIDKDLSIISAEAIINDHDRLSTKRLLELIEELIKALKNENDEFESQSEHRLSKDESLEKKNKHLTDESNSDIMQRGNISDNNIRRKHHNLLDDDDDEGDDNEEESINKSKKQKPKPKEKEEDKMDLSISNDEHLDTDKLMTNEMKADYSEHELRKSEHSESLKDIETSHKKDDFDKGEREREREGGDDNESMLTDPRAQSCFEALEYEKMVKIKEGEYDESLIRKTLTENDLSRFERVLIENGEEEEQESERQYPMGIDYNENNLNAQNDTPVMNVSHISEVSKSKENSELQAKINSKSRKNESIDKKKDQKRYNSNNKNEGNKPKKVKEKEEVPSLIDDSDKIQQSHTSSYYMDQNNNNRYIEYDSDEDPDFKYLTGHSIHSVPQAHTKFKLNTSSSSEQHKKSSIMQSSSKHSKMNQSNKESDQSKRNKESKYNKDSKNNNNNKKSSHQSQSDISQSSVHSISQNSQLKVPKSKSENENILEELPLSDEVLKYEIIKEFKRLYGNKLDKIFLQKNIQNSHNILDIILRNIKLAKQKMMKISSSVDDLITREFIHRHQKELQYILDYYKKEKNKRSKFQERALNTLSKNVCLMKKTQEIQTKMVEAEIERKKKAREINHQQEQVRICNEIYSKALQFEKEKYLEEISFQMEIRQRESEEKRRSMMDVEKYYTDKIAILKEILKREKRERNVEHKAKTQFLVRLEKEKKGEFKRQIEEVFEKFDEEEKKTECEDKNQEEIEKIIKNYYKN